MKINQQRERASAKAMTTQLENIRKMIRGKGVDTNPALQALPPKSDLQVQELRRKLNIPRSVHIHIEELSQVEREKIVLADSLAQREEEITQKDKEIIGLNKRLS